MQRGKRSGFYNKKILDKDIRRLLNNYQTSGFQRAKMWKNTQNQRF